MRAPNPMRLTLLALTLLLPAAARAQFLSVYGTFSDTHVANVQTGTFSYTTVNAPGFGGGVTLNAINLPFLSLGLDLRGSSKPGLNGADTGLAGIKLTIHPPVTPFKPYVQLSGGYLATRTPLSILLPAGVSNTVVSDNNTYGMYEIIGGLDYRLIHFLDVRVIEFGAGKAYNIGTLQTGNINSSNTVFTINSGVVLHF